MNTGFLGPAVATVLTACGIETQEHGLWTLIEVYGVATVLTACGIETVYVPENRFGIPTNGCNSTYRLRY